MVERAVIGRWGREEAQTGPAPALSGWARDAPFPFRQRGCAAVRGVCSERALNSQAPSTMAEGDGLISVDYEVVGKVQGVFFRKNTQAQGKKLGVVGWVQNTEHGTVQGQIQGPTLKVRQLQEWLQKKGSPKSRIDKAEFRNEKKIAHLEHSDFCIVK